MKCIIKILEYLPERDAVVMRACRLNSHKPIDEYPEKIVGCSSLNKTAMAVIKEIVKKYG